MSMKDRIHTGELYLPGDDEIMKEQTLCLEKLYDFNAARPLEGEKPTTLSSVRAALSRKTFPTMW